MAGKNLVALKVIVGLDPANGQAKYPNFNLISDAVRKGMDWSKYIDVHGNGWHYDKSSGHKEDTAESPYGQQIACLCVPQDFADQALALFPSLVSEQTELEFEAFHDDKAHAHEPAESVSTEVLNGLSAQRALMIATGVDVSALDVKIGKALDPTDKTEQGVIENKGKTWQNAKVIQNITLKNPGTKTK